MRGRNSKQTFHLFGTCLVLCLCLVFFCLRRLPELHRQRSQHQFPVHASSSHKTNDHRIAIILLYTSSADTNPADVAPHLLTFCAGAAGGRNLVDFLVFHTGVLDTWPLLTTECPTNVRLINLESTRGLAERLVRVVTSPTMDREEMVGLVESYIQANPYALVEFKPAFGSIFSDYLSAYYTHWGYSDFDVLFGDLDRWITDEELTEYDIVTYTFGDQERLYLRGQFTFHKTSVMELWKDCEYLTAMDERFDKIIHKQERYRVESAEGCYSAAIMSRDDLKVKFAVKAWTDIYATDSVYSHGVYFSRRRNVLYKVDKARIVQSGSAAASLPSRWFEKNDSIYRNTKNTLQAEVGPRTKIEVVDDPDANCMYWAMKKYQKRLCLNKQVTKFDTVFWINGELFKQRYSNTALDAPVLTAPFFHFQEWKRTYRFDDLSTLALSSPVDRFALTAEGAIPIVGGKVAPIVPSPLGFEKMKTWTGERWQLPQSTYCIVPETDKGQTWCNRAVSWQGDDVFIANRALGWTSVQVDWDVTLVLTLQIASSQLQDPKSLSILLDFVKNSVSQWKGKPCVVLVALPDSEERSISLVRKMLSSTSTDASTLLAIISSDSTSRKALLNMAIDAVPTRWYVSGIELERGLALSAESVMLAHREAHARHRLKGQLLVIPQFGVVDTDEGPSKGGLTPLGISDLIGAKARDEVVSIHKTNSETCPPTNHTYTESVVDFWWELSKELTDPDDALKISFSSRAQALDKIELEILHAMNSPSSMVSGDESPILLVDNLSPQDGVLTQQIAREVENLSGTKCFNTLRLTQLANLGYMLDVLGGSFAASWGASRDATFARDHPSRCQVCTNDHKILETIGMKALARAAKTAILWTENDK